MALSKERLFRLKNEIIMAEKLNEDRLIPQMLEAIERYTGRHVPVIAADWDIILNEVYPIIQYELPAIFFRNPRVFLKPRNKNYIAKRRNTTTGVMEEVFLDSAKSAKTQEAILNYTLSEIRYKQEVRKVLLDALLFKHGILWHGYKGEFGMTEEQSLFIKDEQVFVKRLSPSDFLFDPSVTMANIADARWVARSFDVPLEDLLEDKTLDVDKKVLKGRNGYAEEMDFLSKQERGGMDRITLGSRSKKLLDYTDGDFQKSTSCRFVRCYEVFMRPTKAEAREGSKGSLLLYTKEQVKPLRENNWPYKAEGWPQKVLSFNEVPDKYFGMSDLEVFGEIADHKNLVVNLQLRDAQENSKVWIGYDKEGLTQEDIAKIQDGRQTIIGFEGDPRTKITVASPGGSASAPLYTLDGRIQNNLDEKSGVSDIKKGTLRSGEESKFSVEQRLLGSDARPAYRQDLMADFLRDSCHFLNQLNKQFMPITEAVRIVGSLDLEWSENPTKEELQADVDVELDVISMAPENPEKEIQELTTILNLMIKAVDDPAVGQKIAQEGFTFNIAPIIENLLLRLRIRDPEVFRRLKPEESQGYVAVAEIRAAKQNVEAAMQTGPEVMAQGGPQLPSPPKEGQDHVARMEVYDSILKLVSQEAPESVAAMILGQLLQMHQMMLDEEMKKESPKEFQPLKSGKQSPIGVMS